MASIMFGEECRGAETLVLGLIELLLLQTVGDGLVAGSEELVQAMIVGPVRLKRNDDLC